jgi:hypothetical protein
LLWLEEVELLGLGMWRRPLERALVSLVAWLRTPLCWGAEVADEEAGVRP